MTLPRTVAADLSRHVAFEIESIDRVYCNVYQPTLQYTGGAAAYFVGHRVHLRLVGFDGSDDRSVRR